MPRRYRDSGRYGLLQLKGFDEFYEKLADVVPVNIDKIVEKSFNEQTAIAKDALESRAKQSIPQSLTSKIQDHKEKNGNRYSYSVGWDRGKDPKTFEKVCWLNYGTPNRWSSRGYRGRINPRGFITNAKRSAAQRMKAQNAKLLQEIISEIKRGTEN